NTPGTQTLQERNRLHQIHDGIWMWSKFSEEKGMFFNGYVVRTIHGLVIIDPPLASSDVFAMIESLGAVKLIMLTNRDHERESQAFRQQFNVPIAIHDADAPLLEHLPETTFHDEDILCGDVEVIRLQHQKSPGESAFYLDFQKALILGDALIGKPDG